MGTMICLSLGKLEVDWGKNSFFKDHGALFQQSDLKQIPSYYASENWPDGEPHIEYDEGFGKPLKHVAERIELLGFTLPAVEHHYAELHDFHDLDEQPLPFARLAKALREVDVNQLSGNYAEDHDPGKFVRREILDRLSLSTELDTTGLLPDHWEVDLLLENFSPYGGLRLLAENPANLETDVTWDFGPLVESGWARREAFKPGPSPEQCFLIVTEGSSDAKVIEHAIRLRRPHLCDYFRFVDMEEGYPFSGTGNLFRFAQGLAGIGVQNNTLIIFDNDAAGTEKMQAMDSLSLPINMRAMTLPELEEFKQFPTIGPDGASAGDINKKAAAIECYLDLTHKKASKPCVRWSAFNLKTGTYQGELENKSEHIKTFLRLSSNTQAYDFTKIDCVLDTLIAECVRLAEAKQLLGLKQ